MSETMTQPAENQDAPEAPPTPLFRNRDYMILWGGQLVSTLGTGTSQIVFPLLILAVTRSPAQAGFAGFLFSLPYLLISLPAGAMVDRWNRKLVMILCDSGRALIILSIPFVAAFAHITVVQLYIVALLDGTLFTLFNIAEVAALPRVVHKSQIPAASSQNQAGQIVGFLLGPPLGGFLFQVFSRTLPFLVDGISYGVSVMSLLLIRTQFQMERVAMERNLRAEIMEGVRWLWEQPLIRYMAFLTGGLNFTGAGTGLILIVVAQHQGASSAVIGAMFTIGGIGGILGSVVAPRFQKQFSFYAVIVASVWAQAILFPLFAVAGNAVLLGVVSAGLFVTGPIYNAVQFSYRLALIPDELQGRVNSVFRLIAFGFQPLGAVLTGLLLQWEGATTTILAYTGIIVLLALATTINPYVRRAGRVESVPQTA